MKLQADPTIIYGLLPNFDGDIKKSDILDRNNKYNTYMIKGLPPTPIALVSLSSLDAAANATLANIYTLCLTHLAHIIFLKHIKSI